MEKWDPKYDAGGFNYDNYWAGAKKACDDIGMSLPDKSKLQSLYEQSKKDPNLGLPTSGWFWSSSEDYARDAYGVDFVDGETRYTYKSSSYVKVLCVGD